MTKTERGHVGVDHGLRPIVVIADSWILLANRQRPPWTLAKIGVDTFPLSMVKAHKAKTKQG
eukprot:6995368-Pyramimonas_sp.AAC.1